MISESAIIVRRVRVEDNREVRAPSGYYGPEWFSGGAFIGAGPWFHGADNFRGNVNNRFHPDHGYKGPMPNRGERAEPSKRVDSAHFSGNEERDGRGHATGEKR
jgi:hypothetical protein